MRAAVYMEPYKVVVETKAVPRIQGPKDAIVKVRYLALCGSDLHYYRGTIPNNAHNTMGHEFIGEVVELGSEVSNLSLGDEVISMFCVQCGDCWHCKHGYSGSCKHTNTFGKIGLEGGQAEYVRVPFAGATLIKKPASLAALTPEYVLMTDIFTTGYFGVKKLVNALKIATADGYPVAAIQDTHILQLGAGPVGLCALLVLRHFGFRNIVVVDGIRDRLDHAARFGAKQVVDFRTENDRLKTYIEDETDGIGFDGVLEIVGAASAFRTGFDSVRRNGFISVLGMSHEQFPFDGLEAYAKSVNLSFGRCPAGSMFHEALEVFEKVKHNFVDFICKTPPLDDAGHYYELFEKLKIGKVVFDMSK